MIEMNMAGLCQGCMVLQARGDITDKDGKRLTLSDQVYTHHITLIDTSRSINQAPVVPSGWPTCPSGDWVGKGGSGMMSSSQGTKPAAHSSHQKRSPQTAGDFAGLTGFSMFIAKGNEADAVIFAPLNTSSPVKSGYWIGKDDKIAAMAEVVNYKTVPQQVYLTVDYEYVPIAGSRPAEYLDVGFGAIMVMECADIGLRESTFSFERCPEGTLTIRLLDPPADRLVTYNSSAHTVWRDGYIVSLGEFPHSKPICIIRILIDI
jgi:hypothetical protein